MEQYFVARIIVAIIITLTMIGITPVVEATENQKVKKASKTSAFGATEPAVIATSDENVYVVWGSNDTVGNNTEVMFRASNDGGQTYKDKINLSNSSGLNSTDFDMQATDNNVIVSWWETNSTSAEPVIIFSNDHGTTFGPVLRLAVNGTIG
jgi:type II secretory pathway pseudopilin PulG